MCKHNELKYLGEQESLTGRAVYALYNCKNCQSTISVINPKSKQTDNSERKVPALS